MLKGKDGNIHKTLPEKTILGSVFLSESQINTDEGDYTDKTRNLPSVKDYTEKPTTHLPSVKSVCISVNQ